MRSRLECGGYAVANNSDALWDEPVIVKQFPPHRLRCNDQVISPRDTSWKVKFVITNPITWVPLWIAKDGKVMHRDHCRDINAIRNEVRFVVEVSSVDSGEGSEVEL